MAVLTAREQLFLELVNRARMDPAGEASRYQIPLNKGLAAGAISASAKQVLASNAFLNSSADAHSQHMLNVDRFAHSGIGDGSPYSRIAATGYAFTGSWTYGENIAWSGSTGGFDSDAAVLSHHRNLFLSAGHRENILNGTFKEVGIGSLAGKFVSEGNGYNGLMSTQNFAKSGSGVFVTGVHYDETVKNDNFYSIGEGKSGRSVDLFQNGVQIGGTSTSAAGGYGVKTNASGWVEVVFSGGDLTSGKGVQFYLTSYNVKIDLTDSSMIEANVSMMLTRDSVGARALGTASVWIAGNALGNVIGGNAGNNSIDGKAGNDALYGGYGNDKLTGGAGSDQLYGGAGSDKFTYMSATEGGDRVAFFEAADYFCFGSAGFGSLQVGALSWVNFRSGSTNTALDANDYFIFRTTDDTLWYDSDGSGVGSAVLIADLANDFVLTAADILIV
jgi:Ca2+-binding RTX toxin-like protein